VDAVSGCRRYRDRVARRHPWWHYLVGGLVAAYLVGGMVGAVIAAAGDTGWAGAAGMAALHAVALTCCALVFTRSRWAPALLAVATVAGLGAQVLSQYAGTGLVFLVVWLVPFRLRIGPAMVCTAAVIGGFIGASLAGSVPADATYGIAAGLGWTMLLAELAHQLSVTRRQAEAVAQARSGAAVLAERQRLAREIHDVLAHSLAAQVVHLEGTRMLLENGCDTTEVLDRVTKAGDLARAGLDETKRAVAALRGQQEPLAEQLESLAAEFRAATDRSCAVTVTGDPERLPVETRLTVLRTAQEALTNVHKHAPDADVTMDLRAADGRCELEVTDTGGRSGELATVGSGFGLVGMRERAELVGGNLVAGPAGPGFRVRLRVPA
jgi:signal transduction histidine kinase